MQSKILSHRKRRSVFGRRRRCALAEPALCALGALASKSKNQSGQALVEYVLLIAMAAGLSLAFVSAFNGLMQSGILQFSAVLEQDLRTCSFENPNTLSSWEN